ncbi:MAG TPA: superoxide dismutase, Ni [Patescibacteria group bacterium]|jgi:nickel superoxide dismutase|nr:superoxide dismutase, Ni [Patescibacteria group bacterium]
MSLFKNILKLLPEKIAYAHCDIPCGIYDPYVAQRAAHTIIRMTQLLTDFNVTDQKKAVHDIARMTHVKEEHASILEEELETLRNDYFKEEHFKQHVNLNDLFTNTLKSASKARQEINMEAAQEALSGVQEIAEIFFKTKNVEPIRVKSVYPTGGEMVLYK